MQVFEFKFVGRKERVAGAVAGVVCGVFVFAAVVAMFASASGEMDAVVAKMKAAPAASEVAGAGKAPSRPVRG